MSNKYDVDFRYRALKVLKYMLLKDQENYNILIEETTKGIVDLIGLIRKENLVFRKFYSDKYEKLKCSDLWDLVNKDLEQESIEDYIERIYLEKANDFKEWQ